MEKNKFWLITILIILGMVPNIAAEKIRDVCPMLKFQGNVIKNKETKQKEPSGHGLLYVPAHYQKTPNNAILSIGGIFHGDTIENAVLCLYKEIIDKGKALYSYAFNKNTGEIEVKVTFIDGLVAIGESNREKPMKAPQTSDMRYTFVIDEGSHIKLAQPSTEVVYYSSPLQIDKISVISDMIVDNKWAAIWNNNGGCSYWKPEWVQGTLKNGMTVSRTGRYGTDLSFKGDNNTYLSYEEDKYNHTFPNLRLPLKDGSIFEWNEQEHIIRLIYPSGEIYEGTFSKVPFDFDNNNCFDYSARLKSYRCDGTLFKQIVNSSVTDFVPFDGSYIYPDGNRRYISKGIDVTQEIMSANNGRLLPHFDDIVDTHSFVNTDGEWAYYSNRKLKVDNKGHDGEYLLNKLSCGILYYAGKDKGDQLDKELYLKSEQYAVDKQRYDSLRNHQLFYTTQDIGTTFTNNSISMRIPFYSDKLKAIQIGYGPLLPFKEKCEETWSAYQLTVPINNIETLKLLKNCQSNLQLLATFRAGEKNNYHGMSGMIIADPIGLYFVDKSNGAILYDISHLLGPFNSKEIKRNTEAAERQDRIKENQRQAELDKMYHKQAIKQSCYWCLGRGYVQGYMSKEQKCSFCHGKGYEYTHYY